MKSSSGSRTPGRRRSTRRGRPVVSSAVAIEKPDLPWKVTAHQLSLQSATSMRAPAGIFASTSLVVFASARRFTVDAAMPALAAAAPVSSNRAQQESASRFMNDPSLSRFVSPRDGTLEHIPIGRNRDVLQILALAHILFGKPASTFPGYAQPWRHRGQWRRRVPDTIRQRPRESSGAAACLNDVFFFFV